MASTLTAAVEDYLKAIFILEERSGGAASTTALASRLEVSPPSVTGMVRKLAKLDLVTYNRYHGVRLTEAGRSAALEVVRHHRLLELFLVEEFGIRSTPKPIASSTSSPRRSSSASRPGSASRPEILTATRSQPAMGPSSTSQRLPSPSSRSAIRGRSPASPIRVQARSASSRSSASAFSRRLSLSGASKVAAYVSASATRSQRSAST